MAENKPESSEANGSRGAQPHNFPFTEDDVVAAYRRHADKVCPVRDAWALEGVLPEGHMECKAGLCGLSVLVLDRGVSLDEIVSSAHKDADAVNSGEHNFDYSCWVAGLLGVTVSEVTDFVAGFDEVTDLTSQKYLPAYLFGRRVSNRLAEEGIMPRPFEI